MDLFREMHNRPSDLMRISKCVRDCKTGDAFLNLFLMAPSPAPVDFKAGNNFQVSVSFRRVKNYDI